MAAATITSPHAVVNVPWTVYQWTLSAMTAGQVETLTHVGTDSVAPDKVEMWITTPSATRDPITMSWTSSDTTNDTITVRFDVPTGGSITDAVVVVNAVWYQQATGGISA